METERTFTKTYYDPNVKLSVLTAYQDAIKNGKKVDIRTFAKQYNIKAGTLYGWTEKMGLRPKTRTNRPRRRFISPTSPSLQASLNGTGHTLQTDSRVNLSSLVEATVNREISLFGSMIAKKVVEVVRSKLA